MKEYVSGALQPAVQQAYRLRPLVLKVFAEQYDKHADCMPHGIVAVVDIVSRFLCGESFYLLSEQLHLGEFAALEMKKHNAALDMDILVRQKPFREESHSGFLNDVDSGEEELKKPDQIRSEFLGGMRESFHCMLVVGRDKNDRGATCKLRRKRQAIGGGHTDV